MKLNNVIAELIGMHVGDGTLYNTKSGRVWELRGGLNEEDYYRDHVRKIIKSIFPEINTKPKFRSGGKNGCFGFQISKREVTSFFITYGFKPGKKSHTVRIPKYIINSNVQIQSSFVRGLFDTDGCIRFERINNQANHTYPKLEFVSASEGLRNDLQKLLSSMNFRTNIWGNSKTYYRLCISGTKYLDKFMREISPKNKKHLSKYQIWQRRGHYVPNAAVA
jgi:DNA-binding transcriptional regulator WhiA